MPHVAVDTDTVVALRASPGRRNRTGAEHAGEAHAGGRPMVSGGTRLAPCACRRSARAHTVNAALNERDVSRFAQATSASGGSGTAGDTADDDDARRGRRLGRHFCDGRHSLLLLRRCAYADVPRASRLGPPCSRLVDVLGVAPSVTCVRSPGLSASLSSHSSCRLLLPVLSVSSPLLGWPVATGISGAKAAKARAGRR